MSKIDPKAKREFHIMDSTAQHIAGQRITKGQKTITLTGADAEFYLESGALGTVSLADRAKAQEEAEAKAEQGSQAPAGGQQAAAGAAAPAQPAAPAAARQKPGRG